MKMGNFQPILLGILSLIFTRRLMSELGIHSVIRKKRPYAGRKPSVIFPNVLNREFTAETILKKFVTDMTYIRIGHDFVYLSGILDLIPTKDFNTQLNRTGIYSRRKNLWEAIQDAGIALTTHRFQKNSATSPRLNSEQ
ncbi:hypothetical protein HT747_01555 [Brevibacillus borstelensis]|nr:hypothetical protein [Brevibacillus borstelensis]